MFEIVLGTLCLTWKGEKPFCIRLLHFCYSLLVNLSLTCTLSHVYSPKLNLLLDHNKQYILNIHFKLFSLLPSYQAVTLMRLVYVPLMWSDQLGQS